MIWIVVALGAGLAAAGVLLWYAATVPSSQLFGPALVRGATDRRVVALTFDDGPASPYTEQILDILRDRRVPATFFVCGANAERHPEIVRRIVAEGHVLGNHTYGHPYLFFRKRAAIAEQIDRAQDLLEKLVGIRPKLFRPPYGIRWFGLSGVLRERGMEMIQWSDTGFDWKLGSNGIARSCLKKLRNGSVILLHDGHKVRGGNGVDRSRTVQALPLVIDGVLEAGFSFVPIHEFLPRTGT